MTQQLKVYTAFAEHCFLHLYLRLVPSTYMGSSQSPVTLASGESNTFSWPPRAVVSMCIYPTQTYANT